MQFEIDKFNKEGYAGPFKFEGETNYNKLLNDIYLPKHWAKSIHERSNNVVNLASSQIILVKIKNILTNKKIKWQLF